MNYESFQNSFLRQKVELEYAQRLSTFLIESTKHINYWERLQAFMLSSVNEKKSLIIHTWKILKGLVLNLHTVVTVHWSERYGKK